MDESAASAEESREGLAGGRRGAGAGGPAGWARRPPRARAEARSRVAALRSPPGARLARSFPTAAARSRLR